MRIYVATRWADHRRLATLEFHLQHHALPYTLIEDDGEYCSACEEDDVYLRCVFDASSSRDRLLESLDFSDDLLDAPGCVALGWFIEGGPSSGSTLLSDFRQEELKILRNTCHRIWDHGGQVIIADEFPKMMRGILAAVEYTEHRSPWMVACCSCGEGQKAVRDSEVHVSIPGLLFLEYGGPLCYNCCHRLVHQFTGLFEVS